MKASWLGSFSEVMEQRDIPCNWSAKDSFEAFLYFLTSYPEARRMEQLTGIPCSVQEQIWKTFFKKSSSLVETWIDPGMLFLILFESIIHFIFRYI